MLFSRGRFEVRRTANRPLAFYDAAGEGEAEAEGEGDTIYALGSGLTFGPSSMILNAVVPFKVDVMTSPTAISVIAALFKLPLMVMLVLLSAIIVLTDSNAADESAACVTTVRVIICPFTAVTLPITKPSGLTLGLGLELTIGLELTLGSGLELALTLGLALFVTAAVLGDGEAVLFELLTQPAKTIVKTKAQINNAITFLVIMQTSFQILSRRKYTYIN